LLSLSPVRATRGSTDSEAYYCASMASVLACTHAAGLVMQLRLRSHLSVHPHRPCRVGAHTHQRHRRHLLHPSTPPSHVIRASSCSSSGRTTCVPPGHSPGPPCCAPCGTLTSLLSQHPVSPPADIEQSCMLRSGTYIYVTSKSLAAASCFMADELPSRERLSGVCVKAGHYRLVPCACGQGDVHAPWCSLGSVAVRLLAVVDHPKARRVLCPTKTQWQQTIAGRLRQGMRAPPSLSFQSMIVPLRKLCLQHFQRRIRRGLVDRWLQGWLQASTLLCLRMARCGHNPASAWHAACWHHHGAQPHT